ncbi:MAG: CPBP family intramembrane metalloprotease, partial [Planctomycetes bacterium]|nr:CPBP family intramembrane metalloprotease [Planctomycetota bacterium]
LALRARRQPGGRSLTALLGLSVPDSKQWRSMLAVVIAGGVGYVAAWWLSQFVIQRYELEYHVQPISSMIADTRDGGLLVASFALVALVAPLAEELLFRSFLYLPLRERIGRVGAALAAAVLFSAFHAYIPGAAQLFVLSLVFTALFEVSGSLWVAVGAHATYNAVGFAVLRLL